MDGLEQTFGKYLKEMYPDIDDANWMKEEQFGNINRKDQIKDALEKVLSKY